MNRLDDLTRRASADVPNLDELERLEATLLPVVENLDVARAARAQSHLSTRRVVRIAFGGFLACALALAAIAWPESEPHSSSIAPAVAPAPSASSSRPLAPAEMHLEMLEEAPSQAEKGPKGDDVRKKSAVAGISDEVSLLRSARSLAKSAPERSLALVRLHESRFPKSELAEEREVIESIALDALGREHEVIEKREEFRQKFPGSAHTSRVLELGGKSSEKR